MNKILDLERRLEEGNKRDHKMPTATNFCYSLSLNKIIGQVTLV